MTVALRAELTSEEYAQIRVAALQAGCSAQEYVGRVLRASLGVETERGERSLDSARGDSGGTAPGAVASTSPPRSASTDRYPVWDGEDTAGPVFSKPPCPLRVPQAMRCPRCRAVHKP